MRCNLGPIRQIAYVVPDIERALDFYARKAGIGPWYLADVTVNSSYRGAPRKLELKVALSCSGEMQMELIQQISNETSLYTEALDTCPDGSLVHHYAVWVDDYDAAYADVLAGGYRIIQEGGSDRGGVAYVEHPDWLGLIYEIVPLTPLRRKAYFEVEQASRSWDGSNPVIYRRPG